MRVLLALRDAFDSRVLACELAKASPHYDVVGIVKESGSQAKRGKIRRMFKGQSLLKYPLRMLDLVAVVAYAAWMDGRMKRKMMRTGQVHDPEAWPSEVPLYPIHDINEPRFRDVLEATKPDAVVVNGTGILSRDTLKACPRHTLNIHAGILPKYRNVHSDFWAYFHGDFDRIGVTIIQLDPGIDTGDIAWQECLQGASAMTLVDVKVANVGLMIKGAAKCLAAASSGRLQCMKQEKARQGYFGTPGVWSLLQFARKHGLARMLALGV